MGKELVINKSIDLSGWEHDWDDSQTKAIAEFLGVVEIDVGIRIEAKLPLELAIDIGILEDGSDNNPRVIVNMAKEIHEEIEMLCMDDDVDKLTAIKSELLILLDKVSLAINANNRGCNE